MKKKKNTDALISIVIVGIIGLAGIVILYTQGQQVGQAMLPLHTRGDQQLRYEYCELNSQTFPLGGTCRNLAEANCGPNTIIKMDYAAGCIKITQDLQGHQLDIYGGSQGFYFTCNDNAIIPPDGLAFGVQVNGQATVKHCTVKDLSSGWGFQVVNSGRVENSIAQDNERGFWVHGNNAQLPAKCLGCKALSNDITGFKLEGYALAQADAFPCQSNNNGGYLNHPSGIGFEVTGYAHINHCTANANGNPANEGSIGFKAGGNAILEDYLGAVGSYYGFYLDGNAKIQPAYAGAIGSAGNKIGYYVTGNAQIISNYEITAANNELYGFQFISTAQGQTPKGQGALVAYSYGGTEQEIGIYIKGNGAWVNAANGLESHTNQVGIKVEGSGARLTGSGIACFNSQQDMIAQNGGEITGTWKTTDIQNLGGNVHNVNYIPCVDEPVCGNQVCEYWLGEKCYTCPGDCYSCDHWCHNGECDYNIGESCANCVADCGQCGGGGGGGGGSPFMVKDIYGYPCINGNPNEGCPQI
ncbi:MAG: hypothetical protein ABIJ21_02960 [Nanoarchaeota archaeon]